MQSILIGEARRQHLRAIPTVELDAVTMFSEADLPQPIRHRVTRAEDLRSALDVGRLWTATTAEGKVVGFALADIVDDTAYLAELAVVPGFGRRGIGRRLVELAIAWARKNGFNALRLVTFSHVPWNAPFYEKLGFSVVDPPEPGTEMAGLMEEERHAGIDKTNRVLMLLKL